MSPPHFPIGPDGLRGDWHFDAIAPGRQSFEGFDVEAFEVPHKGGRTFGFRVSDALGSMAYIPDHHPEAETNGDIARACNGVDLLVHDAQFVASERAVADDYGHATVDDALRLAAASGARSLALFHHAPARSDDAIEAIGRAAAVPGVEVMVATEGTVVDVARTGRIEPAGRGAP